MAERPRVFLSYVHENLRLVERLVAELRRRGADVWFDRDALPPGVIWRDEIRRAISNHEYFLACFSREQNVRPRSYMNEELELAVEEVRLRGNVPWFVPIRLSGDIPDIRIGATRSLRDIQYVDVSGKHWKVGVEAVAKAVGLEAESSPAAPLPISAGTIAAITFAPPDDVAVHLRRAERGPIVRHFQWTILPAVAVVGIAILMIGPRSDRAPQPRVNVESAPLRPDGMRGPSNAPLLIEPPPDQKDFLLLPVLPFATGTSQEKAYRLEIVDLNEGPPNSIWKHDALRPRKDGTIPVLVPGSYLQSGIYRLIISETFNGKTRIVASYTLKVASNKQE